MPHRSETHPGTNRHNHGMATRNPVVLPVQLIAVLVSWQTEVRSWTV